MDSLPRTAEAGMEQDNFLQAQQSRLTEMLRPYQRELPRRRTLIHGKALIPVDPQRIMRPVLSMPRRPYYRPFEPRVLIDGRYKVYHEVSKRAESDAAPLQTTYMQDAMSLPPRT